MCSSQPNILVIRIAIRDASVFATIFTGQVHENKDCKTIALLLYDNTSYIFYIYENKWKLPIDYILCKIDLNQ